MRSKSQTDGVSGVKKRVVSFLIDSIINSTFLDTLEKDIVKCEVFNSFMIDSSRGREEAKRVFTIDVQEKLDQYQNISQRNLITGSTAEGLSLPLAYQAHTLRADGSDVDSLFIIGKFTVTNNPTQDRSGTFFLNSEETYPGYVRLEYEDRYSNLKSILEHTDVVRLSKARTSNDEPVYFLQSGRIVEDYIAGRAWGEGSAKTKGILHGPAFTTAEARRTTGQVLTENTWDRVPAIICTHWPQQAIEWIGRKRHGWPSIHTIVQIVKRECFVVPVAHPQSTFKEVEWRLSFTLAEQLLAKSLPRCIRKSFLMFKLLCKQELSQCSFLSTYYLKTTLFWACERAPHLCQCLCVTLGDEGACSELSTVFFYLLETLIHFLAEHNLPNYFLPVNNMLSHVDRIFVRDAMKKLVHIRRHVPSVMQRYLSVKKLDSLPLTFDFDWLFHPILENDRLHEEEFEYAMSDCIDRMTTAFFLEGREFMAQDLIHSKSVWPIVMLEDSAKIAQKFVIDRVGGTDELVNRKISTLEKLRSIFLNTNMDNVTVLRKLAMLYFSKSERTIERNERIKLSEQAERMLQESILMVDEYVEQHHFHRFFCLLYLGIVSFKKGYYRDAITSVRKLLDVMNKSLDESESVFFYQSDSAVLPEGLSKVLQASEAIVISAKCLAYCELAISLWRQGDTEEAKETCEMLRTFCDTTESLSNSSFFLLGSVYEEFGLLHEACQAYLRDCQIEAKRREAAIFPDNGLIYKVCAFGCLAFLRLNTNTR